MGTPHVDDGKWNVWESDPKTGKMKKWIGSITNPKDAFEWVRKQGGKKTFRINNVPPITSTMKPPAREVYAVTPSDIREGDPIPERTIPGKYDDFTPRDRRAAKTPVPASPYSGVQYGKNVAPKVAKPAPKTKAEKKLAEDAARLLEQHKADEAAEMEASDGKK